MWIVIGVFVALLCASVLLAAYVVMVDRMRQRQLDDLLDKRAERDAFRPVRGPAWINKSDLDPDIVDAFEDGKMTMDQMNRLLKATENDDRF